MSTWGVWGYWGIVAAMLILLALCLACVNMMYRIRGSAEKTESLEEPKPARRPRHAA